MNFDCEPGPDHADWIIDSILVVNDKFLRQPVYYLASRGQLNRARRIDGASHILRVYFSIATRHCDNRLTIKAENMRAC